MKFTSSIIVFAIISLTSEVTQAQELCRSAIPIPPPDFDAAIEGTTADANPTTEGCNAVEPKSKQWYSFEMNADTKGYWTWLSCGANIDTEPIPDLSMIGNAIQLSCETDLCVNRVPPLIVNPTELQIPECVDTNNLVSQTMSWTGINNLTHHAYVELGISNTTRGNFTTALIQHQPPPNEYCEDAILIERDGPAVAGTLYNARPLIGDVCGNAQKVSVWYSFNGHNIYNAVIRTCPETIGWQHTIDVVDNCGDSSCACVTCQVVNNPACSNGWGKELRLSTSAANNPYYVAISTFGSQLVRGNFEITIQTENMVDQTDPPTAPPTPIPVIPTTPAPVEKPDTPAPVPEPTDPPSSSCMKNFFPSDASIAFLVLASAVALS